MKTFGAFALSDFFEVDRSTIVRALRRTPRDAGRGDKPAWKVSTAAAALQEHRCRNGTGSKGTGHHHSYSYGEPDPALTAAFDRFDATYKSMCALKTLAARRKAAIAMAPLLAETSNMTRKVGRANGNGAELSDLRADELHRLYVRGFEGPCQWVFDEAWQQLHPGEDDA
jgi:hypothetical protein